MTEKEFNAALDAIGLLTNGTLTLTKRIGCEMPDIETSMHPIFGLFCCLSAVEEMIWRAMHTNDDTKLNLQEETQVRELLTGMAGLVADGLVKRMKKDGKADGQ